MYFAQHYLDCLSQASYIIGDTDSGRAVIVDPRRDIEEYLAEAAEHDMQIDGVILTHFHADFLAGHLELAEATGAWIGYGALAQTEYPIRRFADRERLDLGGPDGVALQIIHTPGHTPEAISVLVFEHAGDAVPYGVLTGDALFIGDVGRPDLLSSVGVSAHELAEMLYDSVQHKLMGLDDAVRVFPAHGAGSACGKNLSTRTQSTIGEQRKSNYACAPMTQDRFIDLVTEGQSSPPGYFSYDAQRNRQNRETYHPSVVPEMSYGQVQPAIGHGAVVLDTRDATDFNAGHLRGAISVPLDGRYAETAGMFLDPQDSVIIVADAENESQAVTRLARIGFDNVVGFVPHLERLLTTLKPQELGHGSRISAQELEQILGVPHTRLTLIDVRNPGEIEATGTLPEARNIPLSDLPNRLDTVPRDHAVVLHCAGGWRSSVAASYLRSQGYPEVSDLLGGYSAWSARHEHAPTSL